MVSQSNFSVLDVLDLPPIEREIFLELARNGPQDRDALARATLAPPADIETALEHLAAANRIEWLDAERVQVKLGHIKRHTTLPPQIWLALLSLQRFYTENEIRALQTTLPILRFARARMSEFADHGPGHALRVKSYITQLGYVVELTETEQRLARAAALFHDMGMIVERERHHIISQESVQKLTTQGDLPFSAQEANWIGLLCRWHRREYEPERVELLNGEWVRLGLVASILRVADSMDIDRRRADQDADSRRVLEFFFPAEVKFWTSLEEIHGVRICCASQVEIQVLTHAQAGNNLQIETLRRELDATPLGWTVREISVQAKPTPLPAHPSKKRALVAFPFDAHSLIMAAVSRAHLEREGYAVTRLCYPDSQGGATWLWREALADVSPDQYAQLVVIGDRPDASTPAFQSGVLKRWQSTAKHVSILNRHEANWIHVPTLRAQGAQVTLGGDWAYFWGDTVTASDLFWARIAALSVRDAMMAAIPITAEEQAVLYGLLESIYDALTRHSAEDTEGWLALAQPLLERIAADDRHFFAARAGRFVETYATPTTPYHIEGNVVVFDDAPGSTPASFYWMLERTIEQQRRAFTQQVHFHVPYAVATWRDGEAFTLLAISHWREELAMPVRLLYPAFGPPPQGTESTVYARLLLAEVEPVRAQLIAACNHQM